MRRATGRFYAISKFLAIILVGSAPGMSATQASNAGSAAKAATTANPFQDEAGKLAVRKCANLFSALGRTVTNGAAYGVQSQAEKTSPDTHAVQGVVGMTYSGSGYSGQAAGIVLAAPVGQGCEGQLVRVAPFQKPCKDVLGLLPAGSTSSGVLSGVPLYTLGGNQGQAMLIASGTGCVVVTVARGVDAG
jgi:hypothetical protein